MICGTSYGRIYERCAIMQEDGLIHLADTTKGSFPNPLDWFILELFDIEIADTTMLRPIADFNTQIRTGEIDVGWLFGPHAVTLLKAKMIQRGMR